MHYAVPALLARAAMLEVFFTDFCASHGWPRLAGVLPSGLRPADVKRLLGRAPEAVPGERIVAFNAFGLRYAWRLRRNRANRDPLSQFCWAGREFCRRILQYGLGQAEAVYTFNSAGLEILQQAKRDGRRTVMEQTIAPIEIECALLAREAEAHPHWKQPGLASAFEYSERERAEWSAAEVILCGSEFVREGIARCGGPAEKCAVIPYGIRPLHGAAVQRARMRQGRASLRVLTVGTVGLRKGSPYVLEAARQLAGRAQFRMVGQVSRAARGLLSKHVEVMGPVARSDLGEHFQWADVFLLPSICEGSATAVYEALAAGLPTVCTANTGSPVREGLDGFVVPIRDAQAIVERLTALEDAGLRESMAANAARRAEEFTLEAYGGRLLRVLGMGSGGI